LPFPNRDRGGCLVPQQARPPGAARRNAKLKALHELGELVSRDRAVLAVDLAPGRHAAVVVRRDSAVPGRRIFSGPGLAH
jgi:23S rRNA U2552 (ribose-2'-O)-methylase RlmE/FtsJ